MVFFGGGDCLKPGDALSPFFFQFSFRICHYGGSGKQDDLKLNGTQNIVVCVDDVNTS